jgi:hypothetical protein
MYFSIAWGLNPRLLRMKVENKNMKHHNLFLGRPITHSGMTSKDLTFLFERR